MGNDWLDDLLNRTPQEEQAYRKHQENVQEEIKRKIRLAALPENIYFSERKGEKKVHEEGNLSQRLTLFICTKKGVDDAPDTMGKVEFTLHEEASMEDIHEMAESVPGVTDIRYPRVVHMDKIIIYRRYRRMGLGQTLMAKFIDVLQEQFASYPLSVEFINPVAEYTLYRVLRQKNLLHLYYGGLIRRYYNEDEDVRLMCRLEKKDPTFSF